MRRLTILILLFFVPVAFWPESPASAVAAASKTKRKPAVKKKTKKRVVRRATTARKRTAARTSSRRSSRSRRVRRAYNPWTTPTYAESTHGDSIDSDDLDVRRAAVDALGKFNGSIVVTDPNTGRILTIVNQKLALSPGYQPCSTIKVPVAMAGLQEGLIAKETQVAVFKKATLDLTKALAISNNPYFAWVGNQLGFEKVYQHCKRYGLGERASLLPEENPGRLPQAPPPVRVGGVGKMTSFGEGISLSPLQLAAFLGAVANNGTLYYLQFPTLTENGEIFTPKVKRRLEISSHLDHVKPGMLGATEFGTGRRARESYANNIFGKTGTCTEGTTHLGWFGSFNEVGDSSVVVVVLLTGGAPSVGPTAAQIAGKVYKNLDSVNYFQRDRRLSPTAMILNPASLGR